MNTRAKRAREASAETGAWQDPVFECAVCMEELAEALATYGFACVHPLCDDCNRELSLRSSLRCPSCRAPRVGLSEEAAEAGAYIASVQEQAAAAAFLEDREIEEEVAALRRRAGASELPAGATAAASEAAAVATLLLNQLDAVPPERFRSLVERAVDSVRENGAA